jgi:flagellin
MRINNNLMAMNTHRQLGINTTNGSKSIEKLSSGFRINRAGDDAAGLAISEKMRGQIRGLNQASRNAQDSISLVQTAEGALNETQEILQRMRELAVQSSNDTNVSGDRTAIQNEIDELSAEITRISDTTEFNTQKLLDGTFSGGTFHIGANADQNVSLAISGMDSADLSVGTLGVGGATTTTYTTVDTNMEFSKATTAAVTVQVALVATGAAAGVSVNTATNAITYTLASTTAGVATPVTYNDILTAINGDTDASALVTGQLVSGTSGTDTVSAAVGAVTITGTQGPSGIDITTQSAANAAITTINDAITTVSDQRAKLGAVQNRLEHTIKNLDTSSENLQASESRIRDVDMAKEMMNFTKNNILQQAAQSMLAQANQAPQGVLQLLR